jgi:hypothetical protein
VSVVLRARWLAPDRFGVMVARHLFSEHLASGGDVAFVFHDLASPFDAMVASGLNIGDHQSRPVIVPPSSSLSGRQLSHTATRRRLSWKTRAWIRWAWCSHSPP